VALARPNRRAARWCIIDGEAVACDANGVTSFNRVRYRHHDQSIFLYAFDLLELNGRMKFCFF
jgi:ATP-dependent DNA ligase